MLRRLIFAASLAANLSAHAEDSPASWDIASITWQNLAANGSKYALLEGDRDKEGGLFTYAFFIPAGLWDMPHFHSSTARVFVASGALKLGYGDRLDKRSSREFKAGSLVVVPKGAVHFDGADSDTIIIGVASGPWHTTYLDGSKPASAGTPIK